VRVDIVRRRDEFDRDPAAFRHQWEPAEQQLRQRILDARQRLAQVVTPDAALHRASELCVKLGTDGLRGELTLIRAARAVAALDADATVEDRHLQRIARIALRHRLRRDPLDDTGSTSRIDRALAEIFGT
jgi:magnesium chelatase subunit I